MSMSIKVDIKKAQKEIDRLNKRVNKDAANAINKTATASRRSIVGRLNAETGAKKKNLRKMLHIRRADGRGARPRLFAVITIKGKRLSLLALASKTEPVGDGIEATVGRINFFVKGGFKARMPNGRTGIFTRKGKARLPIRKERIRSNPEIFIQDGYTKLEEQLNDKILAKSMRKNLIKTVRQFNL